MDFSFLRAEPFELPDPQALAIRGMTLANLSQTNQEHALALQNAQRAQAAQDAMARVLPGLVQSGFTPDAVNAALRANPEVANLLADYIDKKKTQEQGWKKNDAEIAAKEAEARSKDTETRLKGLGQVANIANAQAQSGRPDIGAIVNLAQVHGVKLPMPSQGMDDAAYVAMLANISSDPKTQLEVLRINKLLPGELAQQGATLSKTNAEVTAIPMNAQSERIKANASAQTAGTSAARLKFDQEQATNDPGKWTYDPERGMAVNAATQTARPVMAGDKPLGGKKDPALEQRNQNTLEMVDRVLQDVRAVKPNIGPTNTGLVGKIAGMVPGSAAYDLKAKVESIKSNLGFEQLTALRAASPTGGALGAVSEKENAYLQNAVANLDTAQSDEQMVEQLGKVERHLNNVKSLIAGKMPAQGSAGSVGGRPQVRNEAEYNALPPGAEYIGPDGQTRRKR